MGAFTEMPSSSIVISTDPVPSLSNMYIDGINAIADTRITVNARLEGVIKGKDLFFSGLRANGTKTNATDIAIRMNPGTI